MPINFQFTPTQNTQNIFSVTDIPNQFQSFTDVYRGIQEALENGSLATVFDPQTIANWNKNIRQGVVNIGGRPSETNFFMELMGGTAKTMPATDLTIKYNSYTDFNIVPAADATGTSGTVANSYYGMSVNSNYVGPYVQFQLAQSQYSNDGQNAQVDIGNQIYIYDDSKMIQVIKIDKSVDFAWQIYAAPLDPSYIPNIYAGRKMMVLHTTATSGYSDSTTVTPNTRWKTPGYLKTIQPWEVNTAWESPFDLNGAYQDIVNFPLLFDIKTGALIDTFDFLAAQTARVEHEMDKNLKMWVGETNKNTSLTVANYTQKYNGFEGFLTTMFYGGGNVMPFDNTYGFDFDVDYSQIIIATDALKLTDEYLMLCAKQFKMSALRRIQDVFKASSGSQTFETFKRMGDTQEDIYRYDIKSYEWLGSTVHIKEVSAWSDKRFIGQGYFPNMGLLMPGYGMTDSNGQQVPPIEMYVPSRGTVTGNYQEVFRNLWLEGSTSATKFTGNIWEQFAMAVHGVENMYALMPQYAQSA